MKNKHWKEKIDEVIKIDADESNFGFTDMLIVTLLKTVIDDIQSDKLYDLYECLPETFKLLNLDIPYYKKLLDELKNKIE